MLRNEEQIQRNLSSLRALFTSRCFVWHAASLLNSTPTEVDGLMGTAVVVSCLCGSVIALLHFAIILSFLVVYLRYSFLLHRRKAIIDAGYTSNRLLHYFSVICILLSTLFLLFYAILQPHAWCLAAHRAIHLVLVAVFVHHRWREYTRARSFRTFEERCSRLVLTVCLSLAIATSLAAIVDVFRPPTPCAKWTSYCFDAVECLVAGVLISLLVRCVRRLRQISTTHEIRVSILLSLLAMGACFVVPSLLILTWDIGVSRMLPCNPNGVHVSLLTFFLLSNLTLALHSLIPSVYILHACMTQEMKFLCSRNNSTSSRQTGNNTECSRFYQPPVPVHVFPALLPIFMDSVERSQAQSEVLLLQSVLWDSEDSIHSIASSGEPSSTCSNVMPK